VIELTATAAFDRRTHRVDAFACGAENLDRWLRAYAGQTQRRDAARTFVTADPDGNIAGYYTLVAAQVEHAQATAGVRRGLSRHFPIPVALIARLAVTSSHQGTGLGRSLLLDALQRILKASEELAVRAVTVEVLDERAAAFYRHYGFELTELASNTLMVPLHTVRNTLGRTASRDGRLDPMP
jgi:GNAT superfamily N-acetyltransferase